MIRLLRADGRSHVSRCLTKRFPAGPSPPAGLPIDDSAVVAALRDERTIEWACAVVYQDYATPVRATLRRAGFDNELAADAVQEAIIQLWQQRDTIRADSPLWAWLNTVAGRRALDARRAAGPHHVEWKIDPRLAGASASDPAERVARDELTARVRRLVGALAPDDQRLLALRYGQEATIAAIAGRLGLTAPAVETWLRRLHRHLRRVWAAPEDDQPVPPRRRRCSG